MIKKKTLSAIAYKKDQIIHLKKEANWFVALH